MRLGSDKTCSMIYYTSCILCDAVLCCTVQYVMLQSFLGGEESERGDSGMRRDVHTYIPLRELSLKEGCDIHSTQYCMYSVYHLPLSQASKVGRQSSNHPPPPHTPLSHPPTAARALHAGRCFDPKCRVRGPHRVNSDTCCAETTATAEDCTTGTTKTGM